MTIVALVLTAFAAGLPASMTARVTQNTLYSLGDVKGPAWIAVIRLVTATVVSAVMMLQLDWLFVSEANTIERLVDADVPHWPPWERVPEAVRLDGGAQPHLGPVGLAIGASGGGVDGVAAAAPPPEEAARDYRAVRVGPAGARRLRRIGGGDGRDPPPRTAPPPSTAFGVVLLGGIAYVALLWVQGVRSLSELASKP